MSRLIQLVLLLVLVSSVPVQAKDKQSSVEKAIRDELSYDGDKKGKGRPDNPGEHGRKNAAQKQSQSSGKGSKKNDSWEDVIQDERDRDGKRNGNKPKKSKQK